MKNLLKKESKTNIEKFFEALNAIDKNHEKTHLSTLIEIIKEKDIAFELTNFNNDTVTGLTVLDKIYISKNYVDILITYKHDERYFILIFTILHEIAHYMRMKKHSNVITDLNTTQSDVFLNRIYTEENIANRYGLIMFQKLIGRRCYEIDYIFSCFYNKERMDDLFLEMFHTFKSTNLDYSEFVNKYLINQ